ncbi:transposase family protein [Candidatus Pacearchaeota archaeon]|nr:transposase family protein [Candidatus Pacearchaeota archaeon]
MKKEEIRKEFFKLRMKGHSYKQCIKILKAMFEFNTTKRTLQRWNKKLNFEEWDLRDKSTKPKTIHYKLTPELENKIINLRNKTGFGEDKLINYFDVGHTTINKILNKNNLIEPNPNRKKRLKYIRWQRQHPNSLWQMDISDQKIDDNYLFAVIDDCSRYCLGLFSLNNSSTAIITNILDKLIAVNGKPREILTDNGNVFGLRSKHSRFDRWCRRREIKHIRTAIHSPTTTGKIERLFQTLGKELVFCDKDLELFRMRYNHFRHHISLENKPPAEVYYAFHKLF